MSPFPSPLFSLPGTTAILICAGKASSNGAQGHFRQRLQFADSRPEGNVFSLATRRLTTDNCPASPRPIHFPEGEGKRDEPYPLSRNGSAGLRGGFAGLAR